MSSLLYSLSFLIALANVQGKLYFDYAPVRRDIYRDMTNTSATLELEMQNNFWTRLAWQWGQNHQAELNLTSERERVLAGWIEFIQFNTAYNNGLRLWYNTTDTAFQYYWTTRQLLASIVDARDQNITCFRGETPYKPTGGSQWARHGSYKQGDLLYTNQFAFCSYNKTFIDQFAFKDDKDESSNKTRRYYGTVYTIRPMFILNSTYLDPKPVEQELILPPGKLYKVLSADKSQSFDRFDEYTIEEVVDHGELEM